MKIVSNLNNVQPGLVHGLFAFNTIIGGKVVNMDRTLVVRCPIHWLKSNRDQNIRTVYLN